MNAHYRLYQQWQQITKFLIAILLISLTFAQATFYYQLCALQKKYALLQQSPVSEKEAAADPLSAALPEIDKHHVITVLDALIACIPPHVKVHTLEYAPEQLTLSCKADSEASLAAMLEACHAHSALRTLHLKKSSHENGEYCFTLQT